jgi:phage N-6-adenine-methyltransferase
VTKRSIINTATRGDQAKQSIATPWAFIHALEQRFGVPVDFDLAASAENAKAPDLFTMANDALKQSWERLRIGPDRSRRFAKLAYCNPPYANIKPWARKVAECRWLTRWTVMLVPSSYSTDWFLELEGKASIDAIPRIQFEGATHLYPKDLCVVVAGFGVTGRGYWDWRASYMQWCRANNEAPEAAHLKGLKRFPKRAVLPDYAWTLSPFVAEGGRAHP